MLEDKLKNMTIPESELIITDEGAIYHLDVKPSEIAETVLTVGDPGRVAQVSKYFDTIEYKAEHREFVTHTGTYKGKRMSVVSTGIGTDNIDIVLNELDALVNIDFKTRQVKEKHTQLTIIRLGTSGALQKDIPVDSMVASAYAIGLDNLPYFYKNNSFLDDNFSKQFMEHCHWDKRNSHPYWIPADEGLTNVFKKHGYKLGCTLTNVGFYGPQGRVLRLSIPNDDFHKHLQSFRYQDVAITNLEMESSGIFYLSKVLGHRAISLNAIIANRAAGTFSEDNIAAVENLIKKSLDIITEI